MDPNLGCRSLWLAEAGVQFQRQAVCLGGEEHGGHGPQHPEGGGKLRQEAEGTCTPAAASPDHQGAAEASAACCLTCPTGGGRG